LVFDYNKLRGKIKEVCKTQPVFARLIGIEKTSLSLRLNNKIEFTQKEMEKSCDVLGFSISEIPEYFFTPEVQKSEQV